MASPEWRPSFVDRPVEHGPGCAHVSNEEARCDCYLSWFGDLVGPSVVIQPATADGAAGVHCKLDEDDLAAIQDFVDNKKKHRPDDTLTVPSSEELYAPLLQGETRVLELFPGEPNAALQAKLHVVSVDFSHPARKLLPDAGSASRLTYTTHTNHAVSVATGKPVWYTGLSYVWGAPVFDQMIHFQQKPMQITSSLSGALHHLRSTEQSIFLWIDQVCMDQSNIQEKGQQIPLMGLIYSHATNTIIWLGETGGEEPDVALGAMGYIHARLQMGNVVVKPEDFARLDFPPVGHHSWATIHRLLRRPWFSRLWTVQEAVLSRNLFVRCGNAGANWDDLAAWTVYLDDSGLLRWLTEKAVTDNKILERTSTRRSGGEIINSIQSERLHHMTLEHKPYLLAMLVSTRYANATEPKDKIYGVLGMSESQLTPDYSPTKIARDVYWEACLTQIPSQMYELLSCVDHEEPLEPSWVPDWSTARVTEAFGYSTKSWTLYRAGGLPLTGQSAFSPPPKFILSEDTKRITLSGIVFDTIIALGPVISNPTLDIDHPAQGNQYLASLVELIKSTSTTSTPYPSLYTAFHHSLVAGRDASGTAPPTQDHSEVFSLILDATTNQMPSLPGQSYTPRRMKGFFTLDSLRSRKPAQALEDLSIAMRAALMMRRFGITGKGYFALVPRGAREGDGVGVFERACVPFIVRGVGGEGGGAGYQVLGEAYVHGIMRGEVLGMEGMEVGDVTLV